MKQSARVVFICHSSFYVETEHVQMLFDYYRGNLPAMDPQKPLIVFASHRHGDHFSKKIFELAGKAAAIFYVLSDDIGRGRVPANLKDRTFFIGPDAEMQVPAVDGRTADELARDDMLYDFDRRIDGAQCCEGVSPSFKRCEDGVAVRVRTLPSNDAGVAFIVETEGLRFYHAGDLNNWWWDGDEEDQRMAEFYRAQLEKIRGMTFDAAFIPLDPRISGWWMGAEDFLRYADAGLIFPMHFGEDPSIVRQLAERWQGSPYLCRLAQVRRTGQEFLLEH